MARWRAHATRERGEERRGDEPRPDETRRDQTHAGRDEEARGRGEEKKRRREGPGGRARTAKVASIHMLSAFCRLPIRKPRAALRICSASSNFSTKAWKPSCLKR